MQIATLMSEVKFYQLIVSFFLLYLNKLLNYKIR